MLNIKKAEQIVQIDEHHLDKECIQLPSQYLHYAFMAAEAKQDVSEAKSLLEVTEAEVAKKVRANPEDFDIEKVTEKAVSSAVITTKEYREAQQDCFNVQHDYDIAQAVVWAMEHKKKALSLLVELHAMSYSPDVKVSTEGKQAVERMMQGRVRRKHQEEDDND
jgi:chorismate mutase